MAIESVKVVRQLAAVVGALEELWREMFFVGVARFAPQFFPKSGMFLHVLLLDDN